MMDKSQSPYLVASVDRALEILTALGKSQRDMGVTELAKSMGVQKSTVHSLLQTLLNRGFVQQSGNGRYTLGIKLLELGEICGSRLDIRTVARPIMTELADETGKVTLLAVLSRYELIIIDKVEPARPFLIIPKFDFSLAAHSTAVGKVLLAHAPDEVLDIVLDRRFPQYTPYTLTDHEDIKTELAHVRINGYAIGCDETVEGLTCVAVPVQDASGLTVAALSVSSATSLLGPAEYDSVVKILKNKAGVISNRLGHKG